MPTKRIIPCLEVKDGRVVKEANFSTSKTQAILWKSLKDTIKKGADELCFLDITFSFEE